MISDTVYHFVLAMRWQRKQLGLAQHVLAKKAGVSLVTVNQIEGLKRTDPEVISLEKIAIALGTNISEMLSVGQKIAEAGVTKKFRIHVGSALKVFRENAGYSRNAVAMRLEISGAYIAGMETGTNSPTVDKLKQLVTFYGISMSDLMLKAEYLEKIDSSRVENKINSMDDG